MIFAILEGLLACLAFLFLIGIPATALFEADKATDFCARGLIVSIVLMAVLGIIWLVVK